MCTPDKMVEKGGEQAGATWIYIIKLVTVKYEVIIRDILYVRTEYNQKK